MKVYYEYFKLGLKNSLEYKDRLYYQLIRGFILFLVFYFLWYLIYQKINYTLPFTFKEMIIYYLINSFLMATVSFSKFDREIAETIKSGNISNYIFRPLNFIFAIILSAIGTSILNIISVIFIIFFGALYLSHHVNYIFLVLIKVCQKSDSIFLIKDWMNYL